jgi:hypothetical protein
VLLLCFGGRSFSSVTGGSDSAHILTLVMYEFPAHYLPGIKCKIGEIFGIFGVEHICCQKVGHGFGHWRCIYTGIYCSYRYATSVAKSIA